jgi:hypothetical protein
VTIKDDWQALGRPIISYDLMFRFVGITVNRAAWVRDSQKQRGQHGNP